MANDDVLIQLPVGGDIVPFAQDDFKAVSKVGDFLPRLQLYSGKSEACTDGLIGMNMYGIPRTAKQIDQLGKDIDVLVVHGRSKALDCSGEKIIVSYDRKSVEFLRISEQSEVQDSKCMYGPEFLLWYPGTNEFLTYFMSSKSARVASNTVFVRIGKGATLGCEAATNGRFKWTAPTCQAAVLTAQIPDAETITKAIHKFMATKDTDVQRVVPAAGGDTGRAR